MERNKCCQFLHSEFHYSKFCLCYRDWKAFTYSPWLPQKWEIQWIFLLYRWVIAVYYFGWLIASLARSSDGRFFIYVTNWTLIVWVAYLITAAASATFKFFQVNFCSRSSLTSYDCMTDGELGGPVASGCCGVEADGIGWYQKVQWLLFTVSGGATLGVVIIYWVLIFEGGTIGPINANVHLTNGIIALIDIWVSGTPVRILHIVYLQIYGVSYAIFTGIYYVANGTNDDGERYIYKALNYEEHPASAAATLVTVVVVGLVVLHLLFYAQYILRCWSIRILFRKCRRSTTDVNQGDNYSGDEKETASTEV